MNERSTSDGERMKTRVRQFCWISIGILNMLLAVPAFAVDNPDAPDYVAEFQKRAQSYEDKIGPVAGTTSGVIAAYAEYNKFLEAELNRSYRALTRKLNPERKKQLVESQKKWLAFRDAEYAFIAANWTVRQFGTSSHLTRGGYRSEITKTRILTLLNYLKNYP